MPDPIRTPEELDAAILEAIDDGAVFLRTIVQRLRGRIEETPGRAWVSLPRRVDRGLQRLRRKGILRFDRSPGLKARWVRQECPGCLGCTPASLLAGSITAPNRCGGSGHA